MTYESTGLKCEPVGLRKLLGPFGSVYAQMRELILGSYGTDLILKGPEDYKSKEC